jgi:hypothetical protein
VKIETLGSGGTDGPKLFGRPVGCTNAPIDELEPVFGTPPGFGLSASARSERDSSKTCLTYAAAASFSFRKATSRDGVGMGYHSLVAHASECLVGPFQVPLPTPVGVTTF